MHTYTFIVYTLFFSIFFSSFFIYWSCYSLFWINCSDVHVCSMWNLLGFNSLCQDAAGGGTASAQLMVVQDVGQLLHPLSCQRAAEIIELCDKFVNESSWPRWPPLPPVQREPAENLWDGRRCVISEKGRKKDRFLMFYFIFSGLFGMITDSWWKDCRQLWTWFDLRYVSPACHLLTEQSLQAATVSLLHVCNNNNTQTPESLWGSTNMKDKPHKEEEKEAELAEKSVF